MIERFLHEELDQIFLKVMAEAGYLDGPLTADVWKDVRLKAFKLMATHVMKAMEPRPDVDGVGSGLAKIAAAMADCNLMAETRLTEAQRVRYERKREA